MTKLEMQDKRTQLLDANDAILATVKQEARSLSATEDSVFAENERQIAQLDKDILKADVIPSRAEGRKISQNENRNLSTTMKKNFSLIEAINNKLEGRNYDETSLNIFAEGRNEMLKSGLTASAASIVLPTEVRADILAGTATQGQEIVSEDKKPIIPPLVDKLVLAQAGATYMPNLVGNVSIPSYSGTSVTWKGEADAAVDGAGTFSEVNFAPKRLTAKLNVSKLFLAQDGVGAERLLMDNIANAVARKLEATILGAATVSTTVPSGIGYKLNAANASGVAVLKTSAITNAAIIGLETNVEAVNAANGKLAYITNATARGILKGTEKSTGSGKYIIEANEMNGYPVYVTNAIGSTYGAAADGNMVAFGNWQDLCIGQWGGYEITVDPYTAAGKNEVVLTINAYFDAKSLRGATGSSTTLDEYAQSFDALSIA